jgi:hypothetical protein
MGAVDHLPGDRFARLQIEGGSQRVGNLIVELNGAALATALQAGAIVIFEISYHILCTIIGQ